MVTYGGPSSTPAPALKKAAAPSARGGTARKPPNLPRWTINMKKSLTRRGSCADPGPVDGFSDDLRAGVAD